MEEPKVKQERAKRPEIKIAVKDFQDLQVYGNTTGESVTKIVTDLVKGFLAKEDVKKIVEENGKSAKAKKDIEKMENKIRQLEEAIAEMKKENGFDLE